MFRKTKELTIQLSDIPVFYINLERADFRKKEMEAQLNKHNLSFKRVDAVDGSKISDIKTGSVDGVVFEYSCPEESLISKAELATTLSHLITVKKAYDSGTEYSIIMEDDISLQYLPKWETDISTIINEAPKKWSIIQLLCINPLVVATAMHYKKLYMPWHFYNWSAGAYLISRKACKYLLDKHYKDGKYLIHLDKWEDFSPKTYKIINKYLKKGLALIDKVCKLNVINNYLDAEDLNEHLSRNKQKNLPFRLKAHADKMIYNIPNVFTYTKPLFGNRDGDDEKFRSQVQITEKDVHLANKFLIKYYFDNL